MLKELSVKGPFVEALEQMTGYAYFMKDLVTKKRIICFDLANNLHHYITFVSLSLVEKKKDPRAFSIPCTIWFSNFSHYLCI